MIPAILAVLLFSFTSGAENFYYKMNPPSAYKPGDSITWKGTQLHVISSQSHSESGLRLWTLT